MSHPWLQEGFKNSPRSRSRSASPSAKKRQKVDQFGRTVPSRSRSRSRSGSRGQHKRSDDGFQRNRTGDRREGDRSRGRRESRGGGRPRKREGSSSSSSEHGSQSPRERLVASSKPKYLNARLFVANIVSKDITKDELTKHFEKYGNVVDVLVHPKNYAFIQYLKEEHAQLAVEGEHGSTLKGWRLDVKMANENRKGGTSRGRGGERGGRGGHGGGRFTSVEHDRSPLRDDRDPYGDPFRGRGPPPPFPPPPGGDFALRDPYYPDPYRRGYPDPWLPPDDLYRQDPYADLYRDPYSLRAPPPPIECEIFVVNSQLRGYGEAVERRVKEHNVITAVSVMPEGRTAPQLVEECTARDGLFAIFINPQNEMHRSLTLNILHGAPQEHRNMPLDDAITLVGRSFVKYVEGLREKASAAAAPLPTSAATTSSTAGPRVFLPASQEVAYLLNLLADNRALTVAELNTVIQYLQERRDKLIDAESRPIVSEDGTVRSPGQQQAQPKNDQAVPSASDLTKKILSMFSSAGGSVQGVPPANGATSQPKPPTGTPAPAAAVPSSASLINFDNPNVQKALDNLIQSSPSLLKNINTKSSTSSAQMGIPNVSSSLGVGVGYGQGGGMVAGPASKSQGMTSQVGYSAAPPPPPGGMQGVSGQTLAGYSAQGGQRAPPQSERGYGHPPPSQPRY